MAFTLGAGAFRRPHTTFIAKSMVNRSPIRLLRIRRMASHHFRHFLRRTLTLVLNIGIVTRMAHLRHTTNSTTRVTNTSRLIIIQIRRHRVRHRANNRDTNLGLRAQARTFNTIMVNKTSQQPTHRVPLITPMRVTLRQHLVEIRRHRNRTFTQRKRRQRKTLQLTKVFTRTLHNQQGGSVHYQGQSRQRHSSGHTTTTVTVANTSGHTTVHFGRLTRRHRTSTRPNTIRTSNVGILRRQLRSGQRDLNKGPSSVITGISYRRIVTNDSRRHSITMNQNMLNHVARRITRGLHRPCQVTVRERNTNQRFDIRIRLSNNRRQTASVSNLIGSLRRISSLTVRTRFTNTNTQRIRRVISRPQRIPRLTFSRQLRTQRLFFQRTGRPPNSRTSQHRQIARFINRRHRGITLLHRNIFHQDLRILHARHNSSRLHINLTRLRGRPLLFFQTLKFFHVQLHRRGHRSRLLINFSRLLSLLHVSRTVINITRFLLRQHRRCAHLNNFLTGRRRLADNHHRHLYVHTVNLNR